MRVTWWKLMAAAAFTISVVFSAVCAANELTESKAKELILDAVEKSKVAKNVLVGWVRVRDTLLWNNSSAVRMTDEYKCWSSDPKSYRNPPPADYLAYHGTVPPEGYTLVGYPKCPSEQYCVHIYVEGIAEHCHDFVHDAVLVRTTSGRFYPEAIRVVWQKVIDIAIDKIRTREGTAQVTYRYVWQETDWYKQFGI